MSAALRPALEEAAVAFRVGMAARGHDAFVVFVDALQAELTARGSDEIANELLPFLGEVLAAQQRGDLLRVADLLEVEVAPRAAALLGA